MQRWWPVVAVMTTAFALAGCAESAADKPAASKGAKPAASKSATTEPAAGQTAATEPAAGQTAATESTAGATATSEPAGGDTAATEPAGDSFVSVVRAQLPDVARDRPAAEIQAIADLACADLAVGKSADDVVAAARTLGTLDAEATDQATARELIKLAIDTTCLDQRDRVDDF
ncbi:hypothetical protein AB0F81_22000 [Actinoplanes sp. NPDC024001]|uniref:hypothetical protein n=1 Tax=Actinoplanes sp. NPDC024001 TaxID=3154598 RepID=UPI0033C39E9F